MDIDKLGDWAHEADIKAVVVNITLFNSVEIGLGLGWIEFFVFFIKIRNYIFD